ncbi:dolichol kinase EVAN-like isoform X1 [Selaginella moellendorffii]|uniref:dolichol kinase EVAN-like isoform X1 n=1 Tax=Selaginella moellendorffii TaxID=88036 RepID=UPI000D1C284E|nr:dolichol kinase EVAN-like isoform X1 [Selaginella moellendorffii]|eukprot:XP_024539538.1 dolichol kinase EVAN-like isoform X1 [Selaginella moellendorffii]
MEELVVAAITLCVALSLSIDHILEFSAIVALAAWAWFVESRQKGKNPYSSFRPGASTGIFLGSITWPLVLASRFNSSVDPASTSKFSFWSATLCSLRLLNFFSSDTSSVTLLGQSSLFDYFKGGIALFALSIGFANATGFMDLIPIAVLAIQSCGSASFLRAILQKFPGCGTPGELILVASGLALYGGNLLLTILGNPIDPLDCMLQVGVFGLSLMPPAYKCFLWLTRDSKATSFAAAFLSIMLTIAPAWFRLVAGVHRHPVLWVVNFMLEKPLLRFGLCLYWLAALCLLPYLYSIAKHNGAPQILVRKGYHILAVMMFVPAVLIEKEFLHLAFTVALVIFGLVEMLRIWQIPHIGPRITEFMAVFADHRDSDKLIVSHFSLLLGCAVPVWFHHGWRLRPLATLAGILSIGIGDTMASYVGYNYGSWRISSTSKKTVEGTMAGIMSLGFSCALIQRLVSPICFQTYQLAIPAVLAGLLEAYTSQMDNMFVPLVFYASFLAM